MKRKMVVSILVLVGIACGVAVPDVHGQDSTEQLLEKAYALMESIYETKEYAGDARSFRGLRLSRWETGKVGTHAGRMRHRLLHRRNDDRDATLQSGTDRVLPNVWRARRVNGRNRESVNTSASGANAARGYPSFVPRLGSPRVSGPGLPPFSRIARDRARGGRGRL